MLEWLKLREVLILIYPFIIKLIIKDIDEQSFEKNHRLRCERVQNPGPPAPVELGCTALLAFGFVY